MVKMPWSKKYTLMVLCAVLGLLCLWFHAIAEAGWFLGIAIFAGIIEALS